MKKSQTNVKNQLLQSDSIIIFFLHYKYDIRLDDYLEREILETVQYWKNISSSKS